ncbi:MAG: hypothetical protein WHT82_00120 [Limisphaera sp.]
MAGEQGSRANTTAVTAGTGRLGPATQGGSAEKGGRRYLHWLGKREDWIRGFVWSAGMVLLVTGLAKVWSSLEPSRAMEVQDPVLGVPFRWLMLAVGWLEVMVAAVCLVGGRLQMALGLVGWLAGNLALYRLGLSWMDWKAPCGCLGHLTDALGVSPVTADRVMKVVLVYLLLGAVGGWWVLGRLRTASLAQRQQPAPAGSVRVAG